MHAHTNIRFAWLILRTNDRNSNSNSFITITPTQYAQMCTCTLARKNKNENGTHVSHTEHVHSYVNPLLHEELFQMSYHSFECGTHSKHCTQSRTTTSGTSDEIKRGKKKEEKQKTKERQTGDR